MNLKYIILYSLQNTNQEIGEPREVERSREDQINASWLQFLLCSYFYVGLYILSSWMCVWFLRFAFGYLI